jgi:hypothetical protein
MEWDMTNQVFVWHRFISECFHAHILPVWCPYSRLGYPFFADPQSGLFYPITWLLTYFFHYSLYTNDLEYTIHVIGAAFGMRFLLRSLDTGRYTACIFGLVYALSGPFVSNATHIILIYSLCWIPFIIGSYIRLLQTSDHRYAVLTALFLFLQISGGYIGITIILIYVLAFALVYYLAYKIIPAGRNLKPVFLNQLLAGLYTCLLSGGFLYAVSLGLPFIDRAGGISHDIATSVPFTPLSFLTFLFPWIGGNESLKFGTDITMRNLYLGSLTLPLIVASVSSFRLSRVIIFAGCLFFLVASLGAYAPVRGWLYDYVPLMKLFRMAAIFRFFAAIGFIVLAAGAFDEIFEQHNMALSNTARKATVLLLSVIVLFSIISLFRSKGPCLPGSISLQAFTTYLSHTNIYHVFFLETVICITLLIPALFILAYNKANATWPKYLFAALILLDMGIAVQGNVFSTIAAPRRLSEIQNQINKLPAGFPIIPNVPLSSFNQWNSTDIAPPIWNNAGFLRKQITFDGYNGYNLNAYNLLGDSMNFFAILKRNFISTPDSAAISIIKFSPNQLSFQIHSPMGMPVCIGQVFFKGWCVKIDGESKPNILTEDSTHLMLCDMTPGGHLVEMSFEPAGVRFAFTYTVVVFLIAMVCVAALFSGMLFHENNLPHIML